jgi:hypothetical protein
MSFFGPKMITADIDQNGLTDIFVGAAAGNSSYMYKQLKEGSYVALPLALPHGIEVGDAEFLDVDGDKDFD